MNVVGPGRRALLARLVRFLGRHPRVVNWTAGISLVIVVACWVFDSTPEVVPFGAKVGELLNVFALAYVTAWLFNLLVVVVPAETRRVKVERIVARHVDEIIDQARDLGITVCRASRVPFDGNLILGEPAFACLKTAKVDQTPPGWATDWPEMMRHLLQRAEAARVALTPFYSELNADVLGVLTDEEKYAGLLAYRMRGSVILRSTMVDVASPAQAWLLACGTLLSMRKTSLAADVPSSGPDMGQEGVLRTTFERLQKDIDDLV